MEQSNAASLDLKAKVTGYEELGGVTYYNCEFKSGGEEDGSSWSIKKRFSEFVDLQKNLSIKYSDLPELPATTWFKVKETNVLDDRKKQLSDYLQTLCKKESLSTDTDFHNFINLEENLHNKISFNKEKMIYMFPEVDLGVREFAVEEEQKIVIAVCSEENLQTRIASYWDNITIPFFSSSGPSSTVGSLVIFKIISQDPWHVEKMFVKNFKAQAN